MNPTAPTTAVFWQPNKHVCEDANGQQKGISPMERELTTLSWEPSCHPPWTRRSSARTWRAPPRRSGRRATLRGLTVLREPGAQQPASSTSTFSAAAASGPSEGPGPGSGATSAGAGGPAGCASLVPCAVAGPSWAGTAAEAASLGRREGSGRGRVPGGLREEPACWAAALERPSWGRGSPPVGRWSPSG